MEVNPKVLRIINMYKRMDLQNDDMKLLYNNIEIETILHMIKDNDVDVAHELSLSMKYA